MTKSLASFIEQPEKTKYYGEDADEEIIYILRSSSIINIPWIAITLIMAILPIFVLPYITKLNSQYNHVVTTGYIVLLTISWYLLTTGYAFMKFLHWYFNVYIITNKKLLDMEFKGLTYKNIAETTLDNIEDVTSIVHGKLGAVFNIGSVIIQTAGESREFDFDNIRDPARIRDLLADLRGKLEKETED